MLAGEKREEKYSINLGLIIQYLALSALILAGVGNRYIMIVAALAACISIIMAKRENVFYMLIYTTSFAYIFKLSPASMTLYNLLIAVAIVRYLFEKRSIYINKNLLYVLPLFVVAALLFGGQLMELVKMLLYIVFIFLFFQNSNGIELRKVIFFFSLGIIIASVAALLKDFIPGLDSYMELESYRYGGELTTRFGGLRSNPNHYTMPVSIALSCLYCLILSKKAALIEYILFIALCVFGLSSISISFLLALVAMLLLGLIYLLKNNIKMFVMNILILVMIVIFLYIIIGGNYIHSYITRLSEKNVTSASDITSNRMDIWMAYLSHISSNVFYLLFGNGFGASLLEAGHMHSLYIEAVYYLGILGTILYLLSIINLIPKNKEKFRHSIINYLPLVIFLIRGFAISLLLDDYNIYLYFILFAMVAKNNFSNRIDEKSKRLRSSI